MNNDFNVAISDYTHTSCSDVPFKSLFRALGGAIVLILSLAVFKFVLHPTAYSFDIEEVLSVFAWGENEVDGVLSTALSNPLNSDLYVLVKDIPVLNALVGLLALLQYAGSAVLTCCSAIFKALAYVFA